MAKRAGVHVVATASPRSRGAVFAAGADEVVDRKTTNFLDAVTEPVDVLLNLAPVNPERFAELVALARDGGKGVTAATAFVLPGHDRLAALVRLVVASELTFEVTRRLPLEGLPALHAEGAEGRIAGKVVVLPG